MNENRKRAASGSVRLWGIFMEQNATNIKVPFISKLAYGMGAVAGLMLFSRFWDAVNDPVIGSLSDKTHSRWGRYRPWLLIGAPLTALILS